MQQIGPPKPISVSRYSCAVSVDTTHSTYTGSNLETRAVAQTNYQLALQQAATDCMAIHHEALRSRPSADQQLHYDRLQRTLQGGTHSSAPSLL